ncbi:unnamed protein product [Urochloa humidicola]
MAPGLLLAAAGGQRRAAAVGQRREVNGQRRLYTQLLAAARHVGAAQICSSTAEVWGTRMRSGMTWTK